MQKEWNVVWEDLRRNAVPVCVSAATEGVSAEARRCNLRRVRRVHIAHVEEYELCRDGLVLQEDRSEWMKMRVMISSKIVDVLR